MKRLPKALAIARMKRHKSDAWDKHKAGPWDRKPRKGSGGPIDLPSWENTGPAIETASSTPSWDNTGAPTVKVPDKGVANAVGRGMANGLTANFYDELRGLAEAGGVEPDKPPGLTDIVKGGYRYVTGDKEAEKRYNTAVARERAENATVKDQHPYAMGAGEVAGSLALPVGAAASAPTLGARMARGALTGAGVGALYGAGEGETPLQRATGAGVGAVTGGLAGGAAPAVVEGAVQGVRALARPVVNTLNGAINPEGEAGRRVLTALDRDFRVNGPQITPQDAAVARAAGSPTAIIDAGGETTRALARSAANTSPEAREALTALTQDRFGSQNVRASNFVQALTGATGDNGATTEALQAAARRANRPAYARAYNDGQAVWTPELEQLTQAPAVQQAIRQATTTGANRAAADGFQPVRNPFEFDQAGRMTLRTNPDGTTAIPSLQFWDHVQRNLRDQFTSLQNKGERSAARDVDVLRRQLLDHLDTNIPSFQAARAGAARAFGAQDALEAGSNFVTSRMDNAEARRALARMSPAERQLFQRGYASTLMNKINEMGDRRTILNQIAQSPADRERIELALGPGRARLIESFLRVEGLMDRARTAINGNSTTARQLAELGLAGGAYGITSHGDWTDPRAVATGALVWGLTHGHNRINESVARRVGEMLASDDPHVLARGAQMIARNQRMLNSLRAMDGFGSKGGAGITSSTGVSALQGMPPVRADDEKQKSPRVGQ